MTSFRTIALALALAASHANAQCAGCAVVGTATGVVSAAGASTSANAQLIYDTTANNIHAGVAGIDQIIPVVDGL